MALELTDPARIWEVNIESKNDLSQGDRDLVVELINETAWRIRGKGLLVLHEVIESQRSCRLYMEAANDLFDSAVTILRENLPYKVIFGPSRW